MSVSVPSLPRMLSAAASSHDFHVKCRRHDPVFYILVPIFSTRWQLVFPIRLRPRSAFNWGGLSFAWHLAQPHPCLGVWAPGSPGRWKWPP